jgi:hypothetical protein
MNLLALSRSYAVERIERNIGALAGRWKVERGANGAGERMIAGLKNIEMGMAPLDFREAFEGYVHGLENTLYATNKLGSSKLIEIGEQSKVARDHLSHVALEYW